jgi:hypothetical protein
MAFWSVVTFLSLVQMILPVLEILLETAVAACNRGWPEDKLEAANPGAGAVLARG